MHRLLGHACAAAAGIALLAAAPAHAADITLRGAS